MKRLTVFASYDRNGLVHEYIHSYLSYLREVSDKLIFVADNYCLESEKKKINHLVDLMVCVPHGEYDFGSYKRGYQIAEKEGWLNECDELIFCNDSCFCVESLLPVFKQMECRKCDFWGMTGSNQVARHLQSYFLVFSSDVFHSYKFRSYFLSVEKKTSFWEIVRAYEIPLLNMLEENGFLGDAFYFASKLKNPTQRPVFLIQKGVPLIKRKVFSQTGYSSQSLFLLYKVICTKFPQSAKEIESYFGRSFLFRQLLLNSKVFSFFYQKRINSRGQLRIKICKIPLPSFLFRK